ncbi:MAG TPA: hypothetical protein ACFE0H_02285 [Elainellaceae cyanobacterium]
MLNQHRKPVSLSLMSFDLPLWSVLETSATVFEKDNNRFHILLTEPIIQSKHAEPSAPDLGTLSTLQTPRLLWLEVSPYRVIMTMQGNGKLSYRHFWEQGVYGLNRYWLQNELSSHNQIRLRNFTRHLDLTGTPLPRHLRLEYELWSNQLRLGHYVLNLEIH